VVNASAKRGKGRVSALKQPRWLFSGVLEAQRFSLYVGHLCQFGGILNFVHHSGFREVTIVINSQLSARALIDVIAGVCKCKSYQIQPKEM